MAAGTPYFAWIDASETTFTSGHMRWDESVYSFSCEQNEGDPASLTVTVKRPRNVTGDPIGLLGPGRKIWCWFSLDCGPSLFKFRGRLVGIPTSIFDELVTLEFIARPFDVVAQKEALAATLRVLPYYDEVVIDPDRRTDPEVVLEGYTKIWHYGREDHVLTVSDEISGEDGLVEFDGASSGGKVFYDGLGLELSGGPLSRVDMYAEYNWTQMAFGEVEMSDEIVRAFGGGRGSIESYTLTASDWPKTGAQLGDGWFVKESSARNVYDMTVKNKTELSSITVKWWDGDITTVTSTDSTSYFRINPPGIGVGSVVTSQTDQTQYDEKGNAISHSDSISWTEQFLPRQVINVTLTGGYKAERPCTEFISFTMFADIQHILTDPEDGEALTIDDIKSVDLSLPVPPSNYIPMVDTARRSYITTERGNQSLQYLLAVARSHLMKRSRVVEITVAPKLERMPEITLRKNCFISEPRIGEAYGKIIGYSIALDGSDGAIACEIKVGCTIGKGGAVATIGGTPTYVEAAYTGADYQVFIGRRVTALPGDLSVAYEPPVANPDDDDLNFQFPLGVHDVVIGGVTVRNGPQEQMAKIKQTMAEAPSLRFNAPSPRLGEGAVPPFYGMWGQQGDPNELLAANAELWNNALKANPTKVEFKLKNMTKEFTSNYPIAVSELKIPTGYNLEVT